MNSLGLLGVGLILAVETILPFLPSEVALPLAGFTASVPGNFSVVGRSSPRRWAQSAAR